jgi:hypothetical protein
MRDRASWAGKCVDRVEQRAGLVGVEHRRLALFYNVFGAAHRVGRIGFENMAGHQPIEKHPQRGEMLFDGRGREFALQVFTKAAT